MEFLNLFRITILDFLVSILNNEFIELTMNYNNGYFLLSYSDTWGVLTTNSKGSLSFLNRLTAVTVIQCVLQFKLG